MLRMLNEKCACQAIEIRCSFNDMKHKRLTYIYACNGHNERSDLFQHNSTCNMIVSAVNEMSRLSVCLFLKCRRIKFYGEDRNDRTNYLIHSLSPQMHNNRQKQQALKYI